MTRAASTARTPAAAWCIPALALGCAVLAFVPAPLQAALAWDRAALAHGAWWQAWTGHLVHFSALHALLDALSVWLFGSVALAHVPPRRLAVLLCVAAPALSIALLLCTDIGVYRGASGLAVWLAFLAGAVRWRDDPTSRTWLAALAALFASKLCLDMIASTGAASAWRLTHLPAGIAVAWQMHLAAALLALCMARAVPRRAGAGAAPGSSEFVSA